MNRRMHRKTITKLEKYKRRMKRKIRLTLFSKMELNYPWGSRLVRSKWMERILSLMMGIFEYFLFYIFGILTEYFFCQFNFLLN